MNSADGRRLRGTVVCLRPEQTFRRVLLLREPATVGEAIAASELRRQVPQLASAELAIGVFGQPRTLDDAVYDGDRVEVYRPLTIDPKQARRVRVAVQRRRRASREATQA